MRNALIAALGAVLMVGVGCQSEDKDMKRSGSMRSSGQMSSTSTDTSMSAGKDACSHCPGVQVADAKGECPICHMKVAPNETR